MYKPVIGLEIHAQLLTETKLFCSCSTEYKSSPNTNICPVCTGYPGALPSLNKKAVEFAVKSALALNCKINQESSFDRKNYFYPDLPKGYQITQYFKPFAENGFLEIDVDGRKKRIRIKRIHLEEDAGKSIHEKNKTFIDYNRSGIPLIEIVTEPDIESPEEAVLFLQKLRKTLVYLKVSDGNLEEGSLRCDANVSLSKDGKNYGRVEIKNLNSFRFLKKALEYEIQRQKELIEKGEIVEKQTRMFNEKEGKTFLMRTKEEEAEYRYFPEPDLTILKISEEQIERLRSEIKELPDEKFERFKSQYRLGDKEAEILTRSPYIADYFEKCSELTGDPKKTANWIISELLRFIPDVDDGFKNPKISPERFSEFLDLIFTGKITNLSAKEIIEEVINSKKPISKIVEERGAKKVDSPEEIKKAIIEVIENNKKQFEQYKAGKTKLFGFFMGQVMKKFKGNADPQTLKKLLSEVLNDNS